MTDHTRIEKIGGDSIYFCGHPSRAKNRYDTHKWRDLAAQVQPPMTDKELNKMFLNTLKAPYYDRMIGNSNKDFSNVVSAGEMIKAGVKQGKIEASEAKKQILKRKEAETHVVTYQGKAYNLIYPS